jgi:parallel beta-helix repeat protein
MDRKHIFPLMFVFVLLGVFASAIIVQKVRAQGTIYIRADGSIDPPSANIESADKITYSLTNNIYDFVVVERNNIVVDGAGYALQGTGNGTGISLSGRNNVTIRDMNINMFATGIYFYESSSNTIANSTITDSGSYAIRLQSRGSSNLNAIQNNALLGGGSGIYFSSDANYGGDLSNNSISYNVIRDFDNGIFLNPAYQVQSEMEYNTFEHNGISNCTTAIRVAPSSGFCTVRYNVFYNNSLRDGQYGIYFDEWIGRNIEVYANKFTENRLTNFTSYGVYFANFETYSNDFGGSNTLDGNSFYQYAYRENETIDNLNLNGNNDATNLGMVTIASSYNVTLNNCSITGDKEYGVFLWGNSNCSILNSEISENGRSTDEANVVSTGEVGSSITNNVVSSGFHGIRLFSSSGMTIAHNSVSNASEVGFYLYESSSNTIINNTIADSGSYAIRLHSRGSGSTLNVMQNNTLSGGGSGIYFSCDANYGGDLSNNSISYNVIRDFDNGIFLNPAYQVQSEMEYNTFEYNNISNCTTGIRIAPESGFCTVRYNAFHNNNLQDGQYGFYLDEWGGRGVEVYLNNFTENRLTNFSSYGVYFANSETYFNDFGGSNTLNGNNFYHYAYRQNETVSGLHLNSGNDATNLGLVTLVFCQNVTLKDSNLSGDREFGVFLWTANNNAIAQNNITANAIGIDISDSNNNTIYHNFFNNTVQVQVTSGSADIWDNGYPSGGNTWSNYTDVDIYRGYYQNETGSDSIWDHPYVINEDNRDNYPIIPELSSLLVLPLFMAATILAVTVRRKKHFFS